MFDFTMEDYSQSVASIPLAPRVFNHFGGTEGNGQLYVFRCVRATTWPLACGKLIITVLTFKQAVK